jgi:hypothetical protein
MRTGIVERYKSEARLMTYDDMTANLTSQAHVGRKIAMEIRGEGEIHSLTWI